MRKRKIVKYGNSYYISLYKADVEDFGLEIGDTVDIDDLNLMEFVREESELTKEEIDQSIELGN